MSVTKVLDYLVDKGVSERQEYSNLKGGKGKAIIYKDKRIDNGDDPTVYETGVIVLEKGASIGVHQHINDSETYLVMSGKIKSMGTIYNEDEECFCDKGGEHDCENAGDGEAIINFVKRR